MYNQIPFLKQIKPFWFMYDIYWKKLYPFMVRPLLPLPRLYRNLGVIPD